MPAATFERTSCACEACVDCCREQPGPLAPGELDTIAAYLGKPVRAILSLFWASPGAVLRERVSGRIVQVGTITPQRRGGRCVFLDASDRCRIHPVAPFGCAYFDTHQTEAEYHERGQWLYWRIQTSAEYQSIRRALPAARSWRPRIGA